MAEDVLNVNMAGFFISDYNGLSENVVVALKEKDDMIYRQWIIINELERKLSQYCPLEEFYAGFTRKFNQEIGIGEAKHTSENNDHSTAGSHSNNHHLATNNVSPANIHHSKSSSKLTVGKLVDDIDHHYENIELKIHEEEEEDDDEVGRGHELCPSATTPSGDILVDETSHNFENLLEEFASNDALDVNGDCDDSFNSSSSSSSEDEDDDVSLNSQTASGVTCNSGNSTLRKKQKAMATTVAKVAEIPVEGSSQESLGMIEEHLFGSLSAGGTLRRDHPSISKIFDTNSSSSQSLFSSSPLSASSPSVFSSSFSSTSLTSPSFVSSPSFATCPCPDCLNNQRRHPLFSQTLQRSQQQQQIYSTAAGSKLTGSSIKPLAPLGLEPWRLKMKTMNTLRTHHDECCGECNLQRINRQPSVDSSHCNGKVQSYSNGNLSTGSNSSLEQPQQQQQLCHHHQYHGNMYDARQRVQNSSWRKTPERVSSGSESLSSMGNLSNCSCSCDSSQKCGRCSASLYQALPGFASPSPSSPRTTHTRFQFPPQDNLHSHSSYHNHHQHHQAYGHIYQLSANQSHQHHHLLHQRMLGARTDFYAPSQGIRPGIGHQAVGKTVSDRGRKRVYRIGLNIFNKKPTKGIEYLIDNNFVDPQPNAVAKFLISRKGVSRKMIGQYMGNMQDRFSMEVLKCFVEELDLTGLQIDVALRVFQSQFEVSGEAQRIEKFMEAFASRYRECNPHLIGKLFRSGDTVFLLSYAVMMLNTDLHNVNIRPDKKMTMSEFIKNLKGSDDGCDINPDYLTGIYERVKEQEFMPLSDHTSQVIMVDRMIQGKKESMVETHRRFVCHFRMHEIVDITRSERIGSHNRGLFLFNDLLIVTKLSSKKKKNASHHLKYWIPLLDVAVYLMESPRYKFGIRLKSSTGKVLVTLCANNNEERMKFVEDLRESILETEKMEEYLGRVKVRAPASTAHHKEETANRYSKDSGVVDVDLSLQQQQQQPCKFSDDRRSSRTSVDSGMSSTGSANMNKDPSANNSSGRVNRSLSQKGGGATLG